jgi:putative sterol carrier protein
MALTADELIHALTASFLSEKAEGIDATIQVHLLGDGGGDWHIQIANKQFTVLEGQAANPRLTMSVQKQDIADLVDGKIDPMTAFAQGKIKITGDLGMAMRLVGLFKKP